MVHIHLSALDALNVSVVGDDEELLGILVNGGNIFVEFAKHLFW